MFVSKENYKACIYARLSKDDGDKPESDSIGNQKALIRDFLKNHPEIRVVSEQVDDGYSGVNFERPGFKAMMEDIRSGKVDCVIVKDDCVKIGLNRKSLIESRFSRRSPISLTGKGATSFARRVS